MILLKHRKIILNVFLYLFLLSGSLLTAQKAQRIAYIDMEYILENVPEYLEAQNTLNSKVTKWRSSLDKLSRFIEKSKTDLKVRNPPNPLRFFSKKSTKIKARGQKQRKGHCGECERAEEPVKSNDGSFSQLAFCATLKTSRAVAAPECNCNHANKTAGI